MSSTGEIEIMRVVIADKAGACYGVERALNLVHEASGQHDRVQTLGPLIHNPRVVSSLESKGVRVADDPESIDEGTVVIRSHGIPLLLEDKLKQKGLDIVDATCPFVKRAHLRAQELSDQGYFVVILGDAGHAEVEGISSYVHGAQLVTTSVKELEGVKLGNKVGVVVQTTQSQSLLDELVVYLAGVVPELRIFNTICAATQERQAAAKKLADTVEAMVVVGGKNSGNTRRLYEICSAACEKTYHIEDENELDPCWFRGVECVGVTAGASTPAEHIVQVVKILESM